jgi:hypothetical protein
MKTLKKNLHTILTQKCFKERFTIQQSTVCAKIKNCSLMSQSEIYNNYLNSEPSCSTQKLYQRKFHDSGKRTNLLFMLKLRIIDY